MEPFSISCTTCKTRLKVRDEAVIGHILACPKCGGMVLVKAPEASKPHDSAASQSETRPELVLPPRPAYKPNDTLPATTFEDIDSILSDAPARPTQKVPGAKPQSRTTKVTINDSAGQSHVLSGGERPTSAASSPSSVLGGTSSLSSKSSLSPNSSLSSKSSTSAKTSREEIAAGSQKPKGKPVTPADGPTASAIQQANATTGSVAAAAAEPSATAAIAVNHNLLPPQESSQATLADNASNATSAELPPYPYEGEPPAVVLPPRRPSRFWMLLTGSVVAGTVLAVAVVLTAIGLASRRSIAVAEIPLPRNQQNEPLEQTIVPPAAETKSPPQPAVTAPPAPIEAGIGSEASDASEAGLSPPTPATTTQAEPPPVAPPSADTAGANETAVPSVDANDPLGIAPAPPTDAPKAASADPLAKFGNFLQETVVDAAPVATSSAATPESPMPSDTAEPMAPALPRPEPRTVDVAARLADTLPAIEATGVPLADFLLFVQDFSTIPVTLEPDALWFVNASPTKAIAVKGANVTVGDALTSALTPLGLEHQTRGQQLVVHVTEPAAYSTLRYPVGDLAEPDEAWLDALQAWSRTRFKPAAAEDKAPLLAVDGANWSIRQPRQVHAELMMLFEKLRVARKQKPLSRFPAAQFQLATRLEQAGPKLNAATSLNFSQPTLLTTVVQHLEATSGMRILIDWHSLESTGWNPSAETTLVADKQPLRDTLTNLLKPMDLQWRAIDANTLQVIAATDERIEIEFHNVAAHAGDATDSDAVAEGLAQRFDLAVENLLYDPISKHLIAALTQAEHARLAAALKETHAAAQPLVRPAL